MRKFKNIMQEFRYNITEKQDRRDEIKALLRRHEENVTRLKMIELHELGDEDRDIGGMDYSAVRTQNSNMSDLSDMIIRREKELEGLRYEIDLVNMLLGSIRGQKKERDLKIITQFYIQGMKKEKVMDNIYQYNPRYFNELCNKIIDKMIKLLV